MSRPVKIRETYTDDAIVLSRIVKAVESDAKRALDWRMTVSSRLRECIALLLDADDVSKTMEHTDHE